MAHMHRLALAAVTAIWCLAAPALSQNVCQTESCWKMSASLHALINTSANPCTNFDGFLCDGFRSSYQFKGDDLFDMLYTDYMEQTGRAYSERVTELLATECWDSDCQDSSPPKSARIRAYEQVAFKALKECTLLRVITNMSLHDLVRTSYFGIFKEAVNLAIQDLKVTPNDLRYERLLPAQTSKSLVGPLTAVPNVAYRNGRSVILLVSLEPFPLLNLVPSLFDIFMSEKLRIMRHLRMHHQRTLAMQVREAKYWLELQSIRCNRTVARTFTSDKSLVLRTVKTVADAKRLLRTADLTFDLQEFLQLSVAPWKMAVNDSTEVLLQDEAQFLRTTCLLDHYNRERPDLAKMLVLQQVAILAARTIGLKKDTSCLEEFFGTSKNNENGEKTPVGAFRPLLHSRYARAHASSIVEDEVKTMFAQLKETYKAAISASDWISSDMKLTLSQRVQTVELAFQRESISEENLLSHYHDVMESMSPNCSILENHACLLVRNRALQMSTALRFYFGLDVASPHYHRLHHAVYLTQVFTDPPHFRPGQPVAVRLGLLGSMFAHELTHSLIIDKDSDDQAKPQSLGADQSWMWSEEFTRQFRERETCLKNRLVASQHLNKTNVVEDVADLIGLAVAFRMLNQSGDTQRLPGYMSRFSPAQLFYMSSLRMYCSKAVASYWRAVRSVSYKISHTPGVMRIQSMIAGDANFAGAFGCPAAGVKSVADDAARKKCEFW